MIFVITSRFFHVNFIEMQSSLNFSMYKYINEIKKTEKRGDIQYGNSI